jgi:hypothetical protein
MYLCHFLTSVDSMNSFASGSRVPLLSTSAQFFQKGDSILILILHLMIDLRRHRVKHHCSLLSLAPITFDANTFSCYGGSYFATIAVISIIFRRPLNLVGPSILASSSILISAIITYYSEYVPLQNCLLPLSLPPPRALQLSTPTLQSYFFRVTSHEHGACPPRLYTVVYFYAPYGRSGPTGSFLLQSITLNDPTISLSYNNILSRRNIDGFRLYVCS